ncbi:MAG: flagellar filament outer layer protein FlaA [Chloroflexota bacterium]
MQTMLQFLPPKKFRLRDRKRLLSTLLALVLLALLSSPINAQDSVVSRATSLAWSPDGGLLATGTADGSVLVWTMTTWQKQATLEGHTGRVTNIAWSPDGSQLASKAEDGTVIVWNTTTWQKLATLTDSDSAGDSATASSSADSTSTTTDSTAQASASTSAPVVITSDIEACKLPANPRDDEFDYQRLGIPRSSGFASSTGTVEVAVLFADYSDERASSSPEEEFSLLNPFKTTAFFREASYGRMELSYNLYPSWLTLPQSASYYDELMKNKTSEVAEREFIEEVVALAGSGADLSTADVIMVITNQQASNGIEWTYLYSTSDDAQAIQAGGTGVRAGMIYGRELRNFADEYGNYRGIRGFGLAMTLMRHGFRDGDLFPDLTDQEKEAATGVFSAMGKVGDDALAPGFFAFERWQLGWLDDEQIFCQTTGEQDLELSAIGQDGGTKAVMIPLGEQSALVVESRRATGIDRNMVKEGALVYTVDTAVNRNGAPIRVLPESNSDLNRDQAPLATGESITHCNITITNEAEGANGDTVSVSIPDVIDCSGATSTSSQSSAPATTNTAAAAAPAQPSAEDLFNFNELGSWRRGDQPYGTFELGEDPDVPGDGVGKLNYDFSAASADDDFVIFTQRIPVSGEPKSISTWVYGDGSGHLFNIWVRDANGQVWSVPMGTVDFNGWQEMTGPIDANSPWPGGPVYGPDNGTIDYPISFLGLVIDRTDGPATGMLLFDLINFSANEAPAAQTQSSASVSTPDHCANIEAPPADRDVRIHIPNYTNEQIWATFIHYPGVLDDGNTYSADPGEFIQYWTDASQLVAIMNANKEIIRIFIAGTGPTQCEEVRSTAPDSTGKLVFINFTNGTDEGLFVCRENERTEWCGKLFPGDTSDPHPMYPGGKYNFVGMNSGATMTYVATDAPNQTATITK